MRRIPTPLLALALVAVVGLVIVLLVRHPGGPQDPTMTSSASRSSSASAAPTPGEVLDPIPKDAGEPATAASRKQAAAAVRRFARLFLDTRDPSRWRARLKPLVTPSLYATMATIDPRNVPAGHDRSVRLMTADRTSADATVMVSSARGSWQLGVLVAVDGPSGRWLVYEYEDRS